MKGKEKSNAFLVSRLLGVCCFLLLMARCFVLFIIARCPIVAGVVSFVSGRGPLPMADSRTAFLFSRRNKKKN